MDHGERWQLARDIVRRLVASYGDEIVLAAAYGSAARGTDTAYSDLELWVATRPGSDLQGRHLLVRGIAVGFDVHRVDELEERLAGPGVGWPFLMGVLHVLRVLQGDPGLVARWIDIGRAVPRERFHRALERELPALVFESYGRIHSCRHRGNRNDLPMAIYEVLWEMQQALCLLNGMWVTHDYWEGFAESFEFPLLPEGYRELVSALWDATEFDVVVPAADRLVRAFIDLLRREGIRIPDHESIDDLEW